MPIVFLIFNSIKTKQPKANKNHWIYKLQNAYGSKNLNAVYGCGEDRNPRIALVFMNPTKRNVATDKS